jgi:hypothetical protein
MLQAKNFSDVHLMLLLVRSQQRFENIAINKRKKKKKKKVFPTLRYLSLFPFCFSRPLWLSGFILSHLSMYDGLTCLHLHLYPRKTDPTDRCSIPYLANFMPVRCGADACEPSCLSFRYIHLALKTSVIYNSTAGSSYTLTSFKVSVVDLHP